MDRLKQLYQQTILDHNKNPRNFGELTECTHHAHGVNPLCGDNYMLYMTIKDNRITDIRFEGTGCAISKSSGSMMTQAFKDKTVSEATELKDKFLDVMLSYGPKTNADELGNLKVLQNVKEYPVRVKCATLIWRAFEAALSNQKKISTE